ncbi:MAG: virulence RhuM family protein [Clostridia bacterium]|nr:virulence RhuM family protein [Clostridia bacterium]
MGHQDFAGMRDWLLETNNFLTGIRQKVLTNKGRISHDDAVAKVSSIYDEFRKRQDQEYISDFDREMAKYLTGTDKDD